MSLFQRASDRPRDTRLVVAAWGLPKTGKTTFAVGNAARDVRGWPAPIYYLNYDQSIDEILVNVDDRSREDIYVVDLICPDPKLTVQRAAQLLDRSEDAAREAMAAIRDAGTGTLVVDTMSKHWQLCQLVEMAGAKLGKDGRPYQYEFGKPNARFENLVLSMKSAEEANILLLHHAKPIYDANGQNTYTYEARDFGGMEGLVQVKLHLWAAENHAKEGPKWTHGATIELCRQNKDLEGLPVTGADYPLLRELIFDEGGTE